jgi:hypothetical protein
VDRRGFLRLAAALAGSAFVTASPWRRALADVFAGDGPYGPLLPPDGNGIQLPRGFRSRVLARAEETVPGTSYTWHLFPDGGASFARPDGGWVYVSNSEFVFEGGVGALRFDARGRLVDAYPICEGSFQNCAGGATPWGTWLTCEELQTGTVFECDPGGQLAAQQRLALGTFTHEAAAVEPASGIVYLTEDRPDGRLYRFVPNAWGNLESGSLEVAEVEADGQVLWHAVPDPNPPYPQGPATRFQVPQSTPFDGGEGMVASGGHIYFSTKGDNRVWDYLPAEERLSILYDDDAAPGLPLHGVDNLAVSRHGEILVAEDGDDLELVVITAGLEVAPLLRVVGQAGSELTGPAFDPKGKRLYLSSQRGGPNRRGITYEITGPFWRGAPGRRFGG